MTFHFKILANGAAQRSFILNNQKFHGNQNFLMKNIIISNPDFDHSAFTANIMPITLSASYQFLPVYDLKEQV